MNTHTSIRGNQRDLWFMFFLVFAATTGGYAQKPEQVRRVTPDGDLQQVLDSASPGDTITLAPDTYDGLIAINKGGERQTPVVVRAEELGTVTLTNDSPARWLWAPEKGEAWMRSTEKSRQLLDKLNLESSFVQRHLPAVKRKVALLTRTLTFDWKKQTAVDYLEQMLDDLIAGQEPMRRYAGKGFGYRSSGLTNPAWPVVSTRRSGTTTGSRSGPGMWRRTGCS